MAAVARRVARGESGAALVEFAIVLPLLFFLILGMFDYGLMLHSRGLVGNASREAARLGAVDPNPVDIEAKARQVASSLKQADVAVLVTCQGTCANNFANIVAGDTVTVKLTYTYRFQSPVVAAFQKTTTVSSTAQMRYEG